MSQDCQFSACVANIGSKLAYEENRIVLDTTAYREAQSYLESLADDERETVAVDLLALAARLARLAGETGAVGVVQLFGLAVPLVGDEARAKELFEAYSLERHWEMHYSNLPELLAKLEDEVRRDDFLRAELQSR